MQILYNYLLSKNNKKFDTLNNTNEREKIKSDDLANVENIEKELNNDLNNNTKTIIEDKNNRNENNLGFSVNNKKNESKELLQEKINIANHDLDKANENINNLQPKNEEIKEKDNDYNKCFKNRMDMMQAVLDDEIDNNNNNFIRRRVKSRTTVKQNKKEIDKVKDSNEKGNDIKKDKDKNNMENYVDELKEIKEIELINTENKNDENDIEKISKRNEEVEEKDKNNRMHNLKKIFDSPLKKESKNNKISKPIFQNNNSNNINKISEEINFEIFNEKKIKSRKGSYININFSNKSINKNNSKMDLRKRKNSQTTNENNFCHLNKLKNNFNKSYMNTKEIKNNNINFIKDYSALPLSKKYFNHIKRSVDNKITKIIPESLDNFINKNKTIFDNNNFKSNSISQKLNDIKESLEKMSDIKSEQINNNNEENNNINFDKGKFSFNNIYFNILENPHHTIKNKFFSRNNRSSKKADSSDLILYKKEKRENNISLPTKKITKKTNSFSNIYTINDSPIHYKYKNNFNINSININNIHLIGKTIKLRNVFENNLLKNINVSEADNSKSFKDNNRIINKRILKNKKDNNNIIRLHYRYEKIENKNNSTRNTNKINISTFDNFESLHQKSQIKEELKNLSKIEDKKTIEYFKKRNIHKKENEKNNDIIIKNNLNSGKIYYMFNNNLKFHNSFINNKSNYEKNNKIEIYNYSKKTKDIYLNPKNILKDKDSPFEKLRKKRIHSIFPINPLFYAK